MSKASRGMKRLSNLYRGVRLRMRTRQCEVDNGRQRVLKAGSPVLEECELRLLLSSLPSATPDFIVYSSGGVSTYATPFGLTPAQIQQAYGMNDIQFGSITGDGTGQTIAIVNAYDDPNIEADLETFDTQFGLPAPPNFTVIGQNGSPTRPVSDPAGPGSSWAIEISLDVEWAHAVRPRPTSYSLRPIPPHSPT